MGLISYRLGELIEQSYEKNTDLSCGIESVKGISINKILIETKADMIGVPLKNYLLIKPRYFTYVPVTSRNGEKISICFNDTDETYICSATYVCFSVKRTDILSPKYLFMYFNRPEFDRYARFNSWGSARETFDWSEMCNINIELPPLEVQKKYVAIYDAMMDNQKKYEKGQEDLKCLFTAHAENLRRTMPLQKIDKYLIQTNERCENNSDIEIMGISNEHCFKKPNSRVDAVDISKYKIVKPMEFGWSPIHINEGSIALNTNDKTYAISPIYSSFKTDENYLLPKYLDIFFQRDEFTRYCWFNAFGSARDSMSWDDLARIELPIPSLKTQESIANIFTAYEKRKEISKKLKELIKNICPILIKGSIVEASKL